MGAVTVRRAAGGDDLDALNAGNALWLGAEQELRTVGSIPPHRGEAAIFVAEVDDELVGCAVGIAAPGAAFGYAMARVYVQASHRRHGAGAELFDEVCALVRSRRLPGVMVTVPDSEPEGLAAAHHRGLVDHGHHIESALDLTGFDPSVAASECDRARTAGVTLCPLSEDADDASWRRLHAFFDERIREAPDSREGGGNMPYQVFRSFIEHPWQVLVAQRTGTDDVVGITCLMPRRDAPARLNTLFTGVHPSCRGRGVSAALKAEHARRMRDAGWAEILTQNMDGNSAILAVNQRLGFRPVGGTRDLGFSLTG